MRKTRQAFAHVKGLIPAGNTACARVVEAPVAGGMARGIGIGSQGRLWLVIGFATAGLVPPANQRAFE